MSCSVSAVLCNECAYIKAELWSTGQSGWVQLYAIDETNLYEQRRILIFRWPGMCACNSSSVLSQALSTWSPLNGLCIYDLIARFVIHPSLIGWQVITSPLMKGVHLITIMTVNLFMKHLLSHGGLTAVIVITTLRCSKRVQMWDRLPWNTTADL